jgi:hypothetical protein
MNMFWRKPGFAIEHLPGQLSDNHPPIDLIGVRI